MYNKCGYLTMLNYLLIQDKGTNLQKLLDIVTKALILFRTNLLFEKPSFSFSEQKKAISQIFLHPHHFGPGPYKTHFT